MRSKGITVVRQFKAEEFTHKHRQETVRELVGKSTDWAVHADLDEFVHVPNGLTLKEFCEQQRGPLVAGFWLDRLHPSGKCVPIDNRLLEDIYTHGCRVRRKIFLNDDCVVAARYAPKTHHPKGVPEFRSAPHLDVHHFKWQENVLRRLRERNARAARHKRAISKTLAIAESGVPRSWLKEIGKVLGC
jgi:hypothetical protein